MSEISCRHSTAHAEGDVDLKVLRRFFSEQTFGTCIEIGAARPDWLSIAATFRGRGWRVLAVEPNPHFAAMHRALGHQIAEYAAAAEDRDEVPFFVVDSMGQSYRGGKVSFESWSSLGVRDWHLFTLQEHRRRATITMREISVRTRRLETILEECCPDWVKIDLVTIDVEGWELECLSGLDFDRRQPGVFVIENQFAKSSYRTFMQRRGYKFWRVIYPNDIYVRHDLYLMADRRYSLLNGLITWIRRVHLSARTKLRYVSPKY